jgi:hypothetical protein
MKHPLDPEARRAALRLVVNEPQRHGTYQFQPVDKHPFILPRLDMDTCEIGCAAMGLTKWQVERAWQLAWRSNGRFDGYLRAVCTTSGAWQAVEVALERSAVKPW